MALQQLQNTRFLRACRQEPIDHPPVWLMRQAGRYMPEYRALRQKYSLLELCRNPELATEVTMQPIRRFGFDAAILFADILLPIEPMGIRFEFAKGEGPVIENPISSPEDVEQLRIIEPHQDLSYIAKSVEMIRTALPSDVPLIGFAGAPFTIASYIIEGGHSRNFLKTKNLMYSYPKSWHLLMDKIARSTAAYLQMQIDAGASVVQLFDSWVGILGPRDYTEFVLPYSQYVLSKMTAPTIHFSTGTAAYLDLIAKAGGDVVSVDWRVRLDEAWKAIPDRAIQGNLDPGALLKPADELRREVRNILDSVQGRPGHIFNLGHGVFPETQMENIDVLLDEVRRS